MSGRNASLVLEDAMGKVVCIDDYLLVEQSPREPRETSCVFLTFPGVRRVQVPAVADMRRKRKLKTSRDRLELPE